VASGSGPGSRAFAGLLVVVLGFTEAVGPAVLLGRIPHEDSVRSPNLHGLAFAVAEVSSAPAVAILNASFGSIAQSTHTYLYPLLLLAALACLAACLLVALLVKEPKRGAALHHGYSRARLGVIGVARREASEGWRSCVGEESACSRGQQRNGNCTGNGNGNGQLAVDDVGDGYRPLADENGA